MAIPDSFIQELLNRVDIVDVVDASVPLKKAGANYSACCPFHNEKSPSFTVSPTKQFYHCFGCGAHGTALGFLMEYDRLDFVSAVEELAGRLSELPKDKRILVHCSTGIRAELAFHLLKEKGFNAAFLANEIAIEASLIGPFIRALAAQITAPP